MNLDQRRQTRINALHQKALNKKYTSGGFFRYELMLKDALATGVGNKTAIQYCEAVVQRLKKAGHLE
jgi:hypothetical protein